jgi:hypothetical protein
MGWKVAVTIPCRSELVREDHSTRYARHTSAYGLRQQVGSYRKSHPPVGANLFAKTIQRGMPDTPQRMAFANKLAPTENHIPL